MVYCYKIKDTPPTVSGISAGPVEAGSRVRPERNKFKELQINSRKAVIQSGSHLIRFTTENVRNEKS